MCTLGDDIKMSDIGHLSENMHCNECGIRFTPEEYDACQNICNSCAWEKYMSNSDEEADS